MKKILFLFALALGVSACGSSNTLYSWGSYQGLIYESYSAPGKYPPERIIEKLEADYQKARSSNKQVPPGFHAYLGYLYYSIGKVDQADQEFTTERKLFPESAKLMDRFIAKLRKS